MASRGVFVTGTDTGVGKTHAATALLASLAACGYRAVGMKPVAAGFDAGQACNADVVALERSGNVDAPAADRNPYALADAVAPHIAAEVAGVRISLRTIEAAATRLSSRADVIVVEGAGGALVPLDAQHDMLDIAVTLDLPVLLVVGLRLGCLNHALLSVSAIRRRGLELRGWIANGLAPMRFADRNVQALTSRIGRPPVAVCGAGAQLEFDAAALAALGFPAGGTHDDPC
jgi:dethiobiotin synthetase